MRSRSGTILVIGGLVALAGLLLASRRPETVVRVDWVTWSSRTGARSLLKRTSVLPTSDQALWPAIR